MWNVSCFLPALLCSIMNNNCFSHRISLPDDAMKNASLPTLHKNHHMDTQIKIGRFNYLQCLVYFLKVVMYIGGGVDWTQVR